MLHRPQGGLEAMQSGVTVTEDTEVISFYPGQAITVQASLFCQLLYLSLSVFLSVCVTVAVSFAPSIAFFSTFFLLSFFSLPTSLQSSSLCTVFLLLPHHQSVSPSVCCSLSFSPPLLPPPIHSFSSCLTSVFPPPFILLLFLLLHH